MRWLRLSMASKRLPGIIADGALGEKDLDE
jgi:hypothetical protein